MKGLRKIREQRGLTLQEVEDLTGIDLNTLSRYERGVLMPNSKTVLKIAEALGITTDELLNGPREKKIEINLIFGEMPEKGEIDMSENGNNFDVFMGKNGTLGIRGGANFTSIDEIIKFGADVVEQLKQGFEFQKQRGAVAATGD